SGNSMSPNESTTEFNLWAAPVFNENSILNDDNSYVTLFFDNGPVFTNASNSLSIITQDFMVQLTNSDGVISEIMPLYLLIVDENDIPIILPAAGADIVRLGIYLDFIPDGSESIIISPESSSAIYNDEGVNMDGSEFIGSFTLNDQLHPFYSLSIQDGALNIENNDTIIVSFNEPVRISGGQPLTDEIAKENFVILDTTDNDTLENYSTIVNAPSPDSVWVIMNQPFGSEHVISLTVENDFEDFSGNQVLEESTISFTARDNISPGFVPGSAVIDVEEIEDARGTSEGRRSVCYIDLSINDDVFTDSIASLPVQASDFSVGIIQNGGSVSSGNVENIELSETDIIGKDFLRFKIKFDTVPFGSESLFVHAADNAVFDNGFNPMSPDSTSDTLSLYDLRFPTIDTTSIEHDGYVDLYSDSTILVYFSEPIRPESFEYSFLSKMDTINFIHDTSLTSDSLTIFLNTPVMSYDTLDFSIIHLEDTSGNIRKSLIERRFFTKAAGDFSIPPDDTVGLEDLAIFMDGWNSGDLTKELGPFSGTAPNIRISPDNVFGIDDGMAFTQMWLWSLQTFGVSETMQQLVNMSSSISFNDNAISVSPPEDAMSGQVVINYDIEYRHINPGDNIELNNNGIVLSNNDDQIGLSVIEYALHKNKRSAVSFDVKNKDQTSSEIKVSYSFFDEDFRLISKGDSILHSIALPTEFTLMQNYPNPFNPSTNIRFTIPSNSFVRLIVYDITGKVVNEIVNGFLDPGVHNVEWSGTDAGGIDVSSGVYFYRIEASNYSKTYKMVFVK
ncbi:MAG: T9SS type A sorting domain-containing protein, partial [Candidatus Neomarinimicrobiota bacterium]|nr:T9SS type A sorting domain-containing protein [Candidatus Neomarinimicrobiota bacterium]